MIALRPWSNEDRCVLERTLGNPAMMEHLGGAETADQIARRHERYLHEPSTERGGMFTITLRADSAVVGTIGFWATTWQGELVYEAGWMVLPEYAGRGIATLAASMIVARASAEPQYRSLHAFPSVSNLASNAVCRKAGFTNRGECTFEYPKKHFMQCNDWCVELPCR